MLANTQTLTSNTYDRRTFGTSTSVFAVEALALTVPTTLTVSHAKRKSSGTVDTVVYVDSDKPSGPNLLPSRIRAQIKLSYDPTSGRDDIQAALLAQLADAYALVTTDIGSLLNREV